MYNTYITTCITGWQDTIAYISGKYQLTMWQHILHLVIVSRCVPV